MGSPCEVLCDTEDPQDAERLTAIVADEAWRIEDKFSRYRRGNIVDQINSADGNEVKLDGETRRLVDFAETLFQLSDGAFDITSGVLRRAWTFDGSDRLPRASEVTHLLKLVGWTNVQWSPPTLTLPAGMEIDLGGIGKEYAVDRAVIALRQSSDTPCLVNFGGDLAVTAPPRSRAAWSVGIESDESRPTESIIGLKTGALATSGDSRRFLLKDGIRYSHVLDPRTGWPVDRAASSITIAADSCTQAGMLATLAMLKGPAAESFLARQSERAWIRRGN